ncbi:enoyl-CoA hydratase/isomerase [Sphingomonas sp. LH128]|uniref:enoyl-CoA hydratase/isomerase family protein n=1 Tax=Sphingomonas sp. LH128 TaxID=473781 RepID=UPI00027CB243|nr:enoyl-CoA hydratase-related protein [Sphingomonas sp. LH128]EJU09861.1 enoyl-CoA hydratase/isomerase [Sphingomonas sp. LH128]
MTDGTIDGIRLERGSAIDWIVLDRPEAANAFSRGMLARFGTVLRDLKADGAPVIGIRGAGKGFGAGMDLGQYNAEGSPMEDVTRLSGYVDLWREIWRHPKPVIVAVHGYCIGVAAQMASFADILVVAQDAAITEPTIPIGGGFIAPTWVHQVGGRRAKEFAFLPGNSIDGRTAVEWGWANAAVPAENLIACVEELASRIALVPPGVLAMKKRSINRAMEAAGWDQALSAIAESDAILHLEPEVRRIRAQLATIGLKATVAEFKGHGSQEIFKLHGAGYLP